jgi:sterol desaturase/sphingolipid hydroxylase (fatty acid hydroxylase superfamily)
MKEHVILMAFPIFAITLLADWLVMRLRGEKKYYRFADTITNLHLGIGSQAVALVVGVVFYVMYEYLYTRFSLIQLPSAWYIWLLCVVIYDFVYYWAHRWSHEWNIFWGAHVVHHQSEQYNLSVALRQPWFHNLIAFPLFSFFPFLGFETKLFFAAGVFVTLYQYWIHTQAIHKLPRWMEWIFNTPSHHRVHHAVNPQYIDRNYGAVFIIWDRIFGTFVPETEKPVYGITTKFRSFNPLWANVYYYIEMWQLASKMKRLKNKIKMIWAPPGVLPEPVNKDVSFQHVEMFEKELPIAQKIYVFVQFAVIVAGMALLMNSYAELPWYYRLLFVGITIFSLLNIGAILEGKPYARYGEFLRISIGLVSISFIYYQQFKDWFWYMLPFLTILSVLFLLWLLLENYINAFLKERLQLV